MTKEQKSAIAYVLGGLDGLSGSIHEDVEHYQERAKLLAALLREKFPEVLA